MHIVLSLWVVLFLPVRHDFINLLVFNRGAFHLLPLESSVLCGGSHKQNCISLEYLLFNYRIPTTCHSRGHPQAQDLRVHSHEVLGPQGSQLCATLS